MKGMVTETKGRYAVVLCEDGVFRRIKGNYACGTMIPVEVTGIGRYTGKLLTILAVCALMLAGIQHYRLDTLAYSQVTVSSVSYSLNRRGEVIGVSTADETGEEEIRERTMHRNIIDVIDETETDIFVVSMDRDTETELEGRIRDRNGKKEVREVPVIQNSLDDLLRPHRKK